MLIHTTVEVERDPEGPRWRHEDVTVVGDVDLAAETVTIVEPANLKDFSERQLDDMADALWLKALAADARADRLAEDVWALGVSMMRAVGR
jgi:hypothetical protein